MKVLAFLLTLICQPAALLAVQSAAQNQPSVKEPEEINQFYFLDSTGEIRPLERSDMKVSVIPGDGSEFRFVVGEPLAFVVKVASQDVDPAKIIQFVRLSVRGEDRIIEPPPSKGSKKRVSLAGPIPFDAIEYGDSSFKIKPKAALSPGEYMFKLIAEKDAYCFGIDPVKTDLK